MPAFTALNVEPEENIDDEVDTTREIHIEEALKRYQTALKLHAQGPRHYREAQEAYHSLFDSEIFRYPDATTDFERAEEHDDPRHIHADAPLAHAFELAHAEVGETGSSLPQVLYLAYKNHGQFLLDGIKHQAKADGQAVFDQDDTLQKARKALENFAIALDHDPSDADLWRRAARVAAFLESTRTSRYCLEAAIELDDDPAVEEVEPPSLAEGFAGEQLKDQLDVLGDHVAKSHPILAPYFKRDMPAALKKYLDPISYLPNPTKSLATPHGGPWPAVRHVVPTPLPVLGSSWAELGMSLVHALAATGGGAKAMLIELPGIAESPVAAEQVLLERSRPTEAADGATSQDEVVDPAAHTSPQEHAVESPVDTKTEAPMTVEKTERSESVLSRKRSHSVAGIPEAEGEEMVEKRSKRTRRRETGFEDTTDAQIHYATQLEPFQAADKHLFQTTRNMAETLGVTDSGTLQYIAEMIELSGLETRTSRLTQPPMIDLRDALQNFDEDIARILLSKHETASIGFSSFLEHAKPGTQLKTETLPFDETKNLKSFAKLANGRGMGLADIAFEWVRSVVQTYAESKWSDPMKTAVVQVISHLDEEIYSRTVYEIEACTQQDDTDEYLESLDHMIQTLFELHLDVYERITNPNSAVDFGIRVEVKGRLGRWFSLASQMSRDRPTTFDKSLSVRFLWAAVFVITLTEGVTREHVLQCWQSLREALASEFEGVALALPNNAIMPEISIFAADREISKLTTMDFFLGLFQDDLSDPIGVIDSLEPVLNPSAVCAKTDTPRSSSSPTPSEQLRSASPEREVPQSKPITDTASQGLLDLWKFLLGASTELRLFLWNRLGEAYQAIQYPTKVFSCNLKAIEMVVSDFERDPYLSMPIEDRRPLFFKMLKFIDDLLVKSLSIALNDTSAFDIIDDGHLQSSIAALVKLACILHTAPMFEDEVRVGMTSAPSNNATFSSFFNKIRELQVRNWSLLYTLLKTCILQANSAFATPEADLADYLAAVHQVLGVRKCCKASNKIFLKMMRLEFLKHNLIDNWEDYMGQVLYDLYGLKGIGVWEVQDHGCEAEKLERRNTINLVEKVSALANGMPMKDLLKSDLKTTIETMQQAIGQTKSNQQTIHNLRNFTEFLRKPIHPLRLYQALKGNVTIDAVAVTTPDSVLANHQWFFLLGMIAFTKFKGVDLNRRQTPGATDDLRMGATFLRQQLQFTPDQWNAWFRLAECFDYELDESVLWSADKMNKERAELVKYQRNAIHCYALALSNSRRAGPDFDGDALEAIHELYHKFAMRMYASSRKPFEMEPFEHADQERFFIQNMGAGTFKRKIHEEMEDYKVWKYAATLFKKAMAVKPKYWKNSYMYAKCIWKMYNKTYTSLDHKDRQNRPMIEDVVSALEKSVEVVAALPKPRSGEYILEPHYKIISVVHKLVICGHLQPHEGADILQRQPFATRKGSEVEVKTLQEWGPYVIESLQHIREKDKSNWQHRIIMRHARILFDETAEEPDHTQATAAFSVLQKSMFTKTMVMNVWKCDAERPGRHHVYTEQYVRFMVKILIVLKDRVNFESLLRRIRKKGADFYHFNDLWQTCCVSYLRLIRAHFEIEPVLEDVYKNVSLEEFEIVSERINEWSIDSAAGETSALGGLKEAIELKKLNSGLMKAGAIDDLITDCYTALYMQIGKSLPGPSPESLIQERAEAKARDEEKQMRDSPEKPGNSFSMLLNPQSEANSGTEAGPAAPAQEGVVRQRRIGIRKPDLLRKAEQAVTRSIDGPSKAIGSKSLRGSVSSGRTRGSKTPVGEDGRDGDAEMGEGAGDDSSAPGSIHDSADDESDLSDVPASELLDEEEAALMFPGLARRSVDQELEEEDHDESGEEGGDEQDESDLEEEEELEDGENEGDETIEHEEEELVDNEDGEPEEDDIMDDTEVVGDHDQVEEGVKHEGELQDADDLDMDEEEEEQEEEEQDEEEQEEEEEGGRGGG
ncbi:hypothetical protein BKA67DRAFT_411908 [Truncatella angustata]|uniref:Histone transcription regulator 3 homolog n=1 Tax=Truncatella angustata TaxID=152316 RepID=A0A9P8RNS1_9PEZI|nr:uncharacterized protein BKA67DRAFT_411908 [Truncatella angustata]KAH6646600.1 hypothetical protein BKA67DRAFT_411908 [Truncatella angustata]